MSDNDKSHYDEPAHRENRKKTKKNCKGMKRPEVKGKRRGEKSANQLRGIKEVWSKKKREEMRKMGKG